MVLLTNYWGIWRLENDFLTNSDDFSALRFLFHCLVRSPQPLKNWSFVAIILHWMANILRRKKSGSRQNSSDLLRQLLNPSPSHLWPSHIQRQALFSSTCLLLLCTQARARNPSSPPRYRAIKFSFISASQLDIGADRIPILGVIFFTWRSNSGRAAGGVHH